MAKQPTPFPLRLTAPTMAKVKEIAKRDGRSTTQQIAFMVKTHLIDREGWSDETQAKTDKLNDEIRRLRNDKSQTETRPP